MCKLLPLELWNSFPTILSSGFREEKRGEKRSFIATLALIQQHLIWSHPTFCGKNTVKIFDRKAFVVSSCNTAALLKLVQSNSAACTHMLVLSLWDFSKFSYVCQNPFPVGDPVLVLCLPCFGWFAWFVVSCTPFLPPVSHCQLWDSFGLWRPSTQRIYAEWRQLSWTTLNIAVYVQKCCR